jgi:hypothetical protein
MDTDLFPLRTIGDVRKLFERHLNRGRITDDSTTTTTAVTTTSGPNVGDSEENYRTEPNLVLLSIVAGAIENNMTIAKSLTSMFGSDEDVVPIHTNDQVFVDMI